MPDNAAVGVGVEYHRLLAEYTTSSLVRTVEVAASELCEDRNVQTVLRTHCIVMLCYNMSNIIEVIIGATVRQCAPG